jgi:hypothetical protein
VAHGGGDSVGWRTDGVLSFQVGVRRAERPASEGGPYRVRSFSIQFQFLVKEREE